jgi:branched-chain amino acid transport system substrate-binding protein
MRRCAIRRGLGRSRIVILLSTAALIGAACGSSSTTKAASTSAASSHETNVKVGVILPESGPYAAFGSEFGDGVKAAVNYLNAGNSAAHVHYTAVFEDGQAQPANDEAAAKQLTQEGIRYFVGDVISATGYIAEQAAFNQTDSLSFTSESSEPLYANAGTGKLYPWVFGVGGSVAIYTVPFLDWLKAHNIKKIAIVYMNYEDEAKWGTTEAALAKQAGIQVSIQGLSPTATDATAQLRELRASGATTLVNEAIDPLTHTILSGLDQIGWTPDHVLTQTPSPADLSGLPASLVKTLIAGPEPLTFLANSISASATGLDAAFVKYYGPLSGEKVGQYDTNVFDGSYTFDAMVVLDEAIARAGSTNTTKVRAALTSGKPFTGARGTYVFGPTSRNGPQTSDAGLFVVAPGCPNAICEKEA